MYVAAVRDAQAKASTLSPIRPLFSTQAWHQLLFFPKIISTGKPQTFKPAASSNMCCGTFFLDTFLETTLSALWFPGESCWIFLWLFWDFEVIFFFYFTIFYALLRGSNGLSARRVQRPPTRLLVFYNTASHQRGVGGLWGSNKNCFIGKVFVQWACRIILGF